MYLQIFFSDFLSSQKIIGPQIAKNIWFANHKFANCHICGTSANLWRILSPEICGFAVCGTWVRTAPMFRTLPSRESGRKINYRGSSDEDEKACLQQRTLNQTDHQLVIVFRIRIRWLFKTGSYFHTAITAPWSKLQHLSSLRPNPKSLTRG